MSGESTRIGDYEVLSLLGAGGMGRVYKVRNVITDRIEAMKILLPEIAGNEEVAARFLREIKVLAALHHPNIATLHTAVTIENQLVMIMEYVEGQPLSTLLSGGPIPAADALAYIDQVLDALSYAHQRHVIHRDIKPANMMLTADGTVKLMDFGIAHTEDDTSGITAPGSTLGSVNYMSPEQVKGERTDERSDLYSLGISLYELVTAARPFQGDTSYAVMAAHVNEPPRPPIEVQPDLPATLNQIILTSIAKNPAERFQSADAFRAAVQNALRDVQESKTMFQASRDTTSSGSRTPLPPARTAPITRPGNTPPPVPLASRIIVPQQAPAATQMVGPAAAAPTPAAAAPAPSPAPTAFVAAAPSTAPAQPAVVPPAPVAARAPVSQAAANRGLYIAIGAVVVLAVLVAAGLYIPRSKHAVAAPDVSQSEQHQQPAATAKPAANNEQAAAEQPPATPPAAAGGAGAESTESTATPAAEAASTLQPEPHANAAAKPAKAVALNKGKNKSNSAAAPGPSQAAQQPPAPPAGPTEAELDAEEHAIDQLTTRAAAVNAGLDNLKRQQAAAGYGLRGDMAGKQASMNLNLTKAQDAIGRNDLARAKRYAALAETDIDALEKFLGR